MKLLLQCEVKSMCGGVKACEADNIWKIYFPIPKAALPALLEDSDQVDWITWGRRTEQPGYGPQGGWAKLSTIGREFGPSITLAEASHWFSASWKREV